MSWMDDYDASWSHAGDAGDSGCSGCFTTLSVSFALIIVFSLVINLILTFVLSVFNIDFNLIKWLLKLIEGFFI